MIEFYKYLKNKEKWWAEIKSLEQDYKRNIDKIQKLEDEKSDISSRIQILIDKIDANGEKYDQYCFENKIGEFSDQIEETDDAFTKASNSLLYDKI